MTDRLWHYNRSVLQSVMLSKNIEDSYTNVPLLGKVKVKVTFSGRSLRTVVLVFFFLFLIGCTKSGSLKAGPYKHIRTAPPTSIKKRKKTLTKRLGFEFRFFRTFDVFAFVGCWAFELAAPNLIDLSLKRYTSPGCILKYKRIVRPPLSYTNQLSFFDPGLEYFMLSPSQTELHVSVRKGPYSKASSGVVRATPNAAYNQYYLEALSF